MTQRHSREDDSHVAGPQLHAVGRDEGQESLLTLVEAATVFSVSVATLRRLISADLPSAQRVNGVRGREWRVTNSALEQAGYTRRTIDLTEDQPEVRRLSEALKVEQARVAHLDSELGNALLTIGRLRGRLREAGIDPDGMFSDQPPADQQAATARVMGSPPTEKPATPPRPPSRP